MSYYVPIFEDIVDSSIWEEPDFVVKVFLTMLAKKKRGGYVWGTAFNISRWAKKTEEETLEALRILSSPDTRRLEPQKFEGRRIEKVEGGWLILNAETYQEKMEEVNAKASNASRQARFRQKQKGDPTGNGSPEEKPAAPPVEASVWSPTPEQVRLGAIMGRRPTTPWKAEHLKGWRLVAPIDEEDLKKLEAYYRYRGAGEKEMWKKTKFDTLMNDLTCQIEKARKWRPPSMIQ